MLIYRLTTDDPDKKLEKRLREIVGNQNGWPLPNMKETTEDAFWHYHSSQGFQADVYVGQKRVDDKWATVRLFLCDTGRRVAGGFAVAHFYDYPPRPNSVRYWEWTACVHEWTEKNVGRCLHRYTCTKCSSSHEVDSSD